MEVDEPELEVGNFLKLLSDFKVNTYLLSQHSLLESWPLNGISSTAIHPTTTTPNDRKALVPLAAVYPSPGFTTDGNYIYIYAQDNLQKIGVGHQSVKGHVYLSKNLGKKPENNTSLYLGMVNKHMYLYIPSTSNGDSPTGRKQISVTVIDPNTLDELSTIKFVLSSTEVHETVMVCDGRYLYIIYRKKEKKSKSRADVGGNTSTLAPLPPSSTVPATSTSVPIPPVSGLSSGFYAPSDLPAEDIYVPHSPLNNLKISISEADAEAKDNEDDYSSRSRSYSDMEELADYSSDEDDEGEEDEADSYSRRSYPPGHAPIPILASNQVNPPSSSSEQKHQEGNRIFVDVFDPLKSNGNNEEIICERTFELKGAETSGKSSPPCSINEFTKGTFFTNGFELILFFSTGNHRRPHIEQARVFSLKNGRHIEDITMKNLSAPLILSYENKSNKIWTYGTTYNTVSKWSNLSPAPQYSFETLDEMEVEDGTKSESKAIHTVSEYTPEHFLNQDTYSIKNKTTKEVKLKWKPMDIIVFILSNMDRISRHHKMYTQSKVIDDTMCAEGGSVHFCADSSPITFKHIYSCINHTLDLINQKPSDNNTHAYILISMLRLLKVNIYEVMTGSVPLTQSLINSFKDSKVADEILNGLKNLLLRFISSPPIESASNVIQSTCMDALTVGFLLFYRKPEERLEFLLEILEKSKSNPFCDVLAGKLIAELAQWYRVGEMLTDETKQKETKKEDKKTKEKFTKVSGIEKVREEFTTNKTAKNFLIALVEYAVKEVKTNIGNSKQVKSVAVSPIVKLLLTLQREIIANTFGRQLLLEYTRFTFQICSDLLNEILNNHKDLFLVTKENKCLYDNICQTSIIGVVLRSLILGLCRKNHNFSSEIINELFPHLLKLMNSVDEINKVHPYAKQSDNQYLKANIKKERKQMIETKHPYPQGKYYFKETVSFPGCQSLLLSFDTQSKTCSQSDCLQIVQGTSKSFSQPLLYGNNFPKNLVIDGDTVTFMFKSSVRYSQKTNLASRWGFRCYVSEISTSASSQQPISYWHLDMQNSLAILCGKLASILVEGEPVSESEEKVNNWLLNNLLQGGLDECASKVDQSCIEWLQAFTEMNEVPQLFKWIKSQDIQPMMPKSKSEHLEKVERYVLAAMFKHMYLVNDAILLSKLIEEKQNIPGDIQAKFKFLGRKVQQISKWILQKGQMEQEWQIAVQENDGVDFFERYRQQPEKLAEMCEMKGVEFSLMDTEETMKMLIKKLQEDIEALKNDQKNPNFVPPNAFEKVSKPVVERMKFLLKLTPAYGVLNHPSAFESNPFSATSDALDAFRKSQPDATNMSDIDFHPLSRSLSVLPSALTSSEKEKLRELEYQKERAFGRRVSELRKWIHSYHSWQKWRESTLLIKGLKESEIPPSSPIMAIVSFAENSTMNLVDLEKSVKTHVNRAKTRVQGLKYLHNLIQSGSFSSVRHQILNQIRSTFRKCLSKSHFLDNISSCGHDLTLSVENNFTLLFEELVKILGNTTSDTTSRLLSLGCCSSLSFKDSDVHLLQSTNIFSILCDINSERESVLSKSEEKELTDSQEEKLSKKSDKDEENKRKNTLRKAAWTAFRLLSTRISSWSLSNAPHNGIVQLQGQVFELMCSELHRLSKNLHNQKIGEKSSVDHEDENQCYQLLYMLLMLGVNSSRTKSLSNPENIKSLISFLGTNTSPRAKRLVFRLCRRLLPMQPVESLNSFVNLFLDEIGKWLFGSQKVVSSPNSDSMQIESTSEKINTSFDSEDEKPASFGINLNSWFMGDKKLLEVCYATLGMDFTFEGKSSSVSNEVRAQQINQELLKNVTVLLKVGTNDACTRLAKELSNSGGVVSIVEITEETNKQTTKERNNPNKTQLQKWPLYWADGYVASSLISETVSVLRYLITSSPDWLTTIFKVIELNLNELSNYVKIIESDQSESLMNNTSFHRLIALLCMIGGFDENIRVGGKVNVRSYNGESNLPATVVNYEPNSTKVEVIFDELENKSVQKVDVKNVNSIPEINIQTEFMNTLAAKVIPSLLSTLSMSSNKSSTTTSSTSRWLASQLKTRSIGALSELLKTQEGAKILLSPDCTQLIAKLIETAKNCDPVNGINELTLLRSKLSERLWNLKTNPSGGKSTTLSPMVAILPFFPHSSKSDLLPTCLDKGKNLGLIFYGSDKRSVEFSGFTPASLGRSSRTQLFNAAGLVGFDSRRSKNPALEAIVPGNVVIPLNIDYYFEVLIEKFTSQSIMSIGFAIEGNQTWSTGSYLYLANRNKASFTGSQKNTAPYGNHFRTNQVIGCGWDSQSKTIYFTHNGEDMGPAFENVTFPSDRVVPVIGIGKGVKVTVNFGQSEFTYNLESASTLDEETKKQRKKEVEERRKKELEEEEKKRKKQLEQEERQKLQQIQPILGMGYTKSQALKAFEMTSWSGTEPAVIWLLEHAGELPEEDEPPKPPPSESSSSTSTTQEKKPETLTSSSEQTEKVVEKGPLEISYKPENSMNFLLSSSYIFQTKKSNNSGPNVSSEWEERFIPELKSFMERDGFRAFEVNDYLEQIRNALRQGKEDEALNIYLQIWADAPSYIFRLPGVGGSKSDQTADSKELKINQIRLGDHLTVKEPEKSTSTSTTTTTNTIWIEEMNSTIGRTGKVIALDHKTQLVLVRFFSADYARLEEWWYNASSLEKPTKTYTNETFPSSVSEIEEMIINTEEHMFSVYARHILISILPFCHVTLDQQPINVLDALQLVGYENFSSCDFISSSKMTKNEEDKGMHCIGSKIVELFKSSTLEGASKLCKQLINDAIRYFQEAGRLINNMQNVNYDSTSLGNPVYVEIKNAHALLVVFDKSSRLETPAEIGFYLDEACSNPVRVITEQSSLTSVFIPSGKFYYKFTSRLNPSCRGKFSVIPATLDVAIARWLIDFTFNYALFTNTDLSELMNMLTNYLFNNSVPSPLKEGVIGLMSSLVHKLRSKGKIGLKSISSFDWKRLSKLKSEMFYIHEYERRKGLSSSSLTSPLYSTYFQSLVDFNVSMKLFKLFLKPKKKQKVDEELIVAIALVSALENATGKPSTSSSSTSSSSTTTTSTSTSTSTPQLTSTTNQPSDVKPGSPIGEVTTTTSKASQQQQEEDEKMDSDQDSGMPMDEDEELRLALAMSMEGEGQEPSKETATTTTSSLKDSIEGEIEDMKYDDNLDGDFDEENDDFDYQEEEEEEEEYEEFQKISSVPASFSMISNEVSKTTPEKIPTTPPSLSTSLTTPSTTTAATTATTIKKKDENSWFHSIISLATFIEFLNCCENSDNNALNSKYVSRIFTSIVTNAWEKTKGSNTELQNRYVLILNIPTVPADKKNELTLMLQDFFEEQAEVVKGSLYLSVDDKMQTQPWCFLELQSSKQVALMSDKLITNKLKLPAHLKQSQSKKDTTPAMTLHKLSDLGAGPSSTLHHTKTTTATATPSTPVSTTSPVAKTTHGSPKVHDNKPEETSSSSTSSSSSSSQKLFTEQDMIGSILPQFLRSLLYSDMTKSLTPEAKELFTEIFVSYSNSVDGVMTRDHIRKLHARESNGEEISEENLSYIMKTYDVKKCKLEQQQKQQQQQQSDTEVEGITLTGFLNLKVSQCDVEPMETWKEIFNLGYDLHMTNYSFEDVNQAFHCLDLSKNDRGRLSKLTTSTTTTTTTTTTSSPTHKKHNHISILEDLLKFTESHFSEMSESPMSLTLSHIQAIKPESSLGQSYPNLAKLDVRSLRLYFTLLQSFNQYVSDCLPYINFESDSYLASYVKKFSSFIFHSTKMEFFYEVLDKTSITGMKQPTVSYNRLKLASRLEKRDQNQKFTDDSIIKDTAFGIAFSQLKHADPLLFRQKKPTGSEAHFSLLIDFKGEYVEGEGGPYRQFFTDVSKELKGSLPLFIPCPNAQQKTGKNRDKYVVAPSLKSKMYLKMYRFLGQLMGMSIRTGVLLTLDLPSFFWKQLLGETPTIQDLEAIDISFVSSMQYFRVCSQEELEGKEKTIFEKFQIPLSDKSSHILIKDGDMIDLNYENRYRYIQLAENARLNESKLQVKEIRKGLNDVVPTHLLNILTWQDLERRVCGKPTIDIKLLRRHTEYIGVQPNSPHITYFWQVLEEFSQEDRRAFIRFAWGQERLPANDLEFKRTSTRMLIKPYTSFKDPDQAFPKADTCFFNLHLPEYSNPEILRQKLLFAIHTDADSMNADNPHSDTQHPESSVASHIRLGGEHFLVDPRLSRFLGNSM
eukprot:TRINITY_DN229_c1_g1_i2.p1 TRINITY_DN229_c1_g1~~TRINITY_DN229_c1_g1_i2.p1  ORF type:complete len:4506 (-),score=1363.41 TRINITY_DN229_c1_g1_i2:44-12730(-)